MAIQSYEKIKLTIGFIATSDSFNIKDGQSIVAQRRNEITGNGRKMSAMQTRI